MHYIAKTDKRKYCFEPVGFHCDLKTIISIVLNDLKDPEEKNLLRDTSELSFEQHTIEPTAQQALTASTAPQAPQAPQAQYVHYNIYWTKNGKEQLIISADSNGPNGPNGPNDSSSPSGTSGPSSPSGTSGPSGTSDLKFIQTWCILDNNERILNIHHILEDYKKVKSDLTTKFVEHVKTKIRDEIYNNPIGNAIVKRNLPAIIINLNGKNINNYIHSILHITPYMLVKYLYPDNNDIVVKIVECFNPDVHEVDVFGNSAYDYENLDFF